MLCPAVAKAFLWSQGSCDVMSRCPKPLGKGGFGSYHDLSPYISILYTIILFFISPQRMIFSYFRDICRQIFACVFVHNNDKILYSRTGCKMRRPDDGESGCVGLKNEAVWSRIASLRRIRAIFAKIKWNI